MIQEYGLKAYSEGLEVITTIDSKFQNKASSAGRTFMRSALRKFHLQGASY